MIKRNKLTNKKDNHNEITISTNVPDNTQNLILQELIKINKTIGKVLFNVKDHEKRITRLEKGVGGK